MSDSERRYADVFDIRAEVLKRTAKSFAKKAKAVVAIIIALFVVSQLNSAKQADDNYRARRYVVTPQLRDALKNAATLKGIRAAAETKKGSRSSSIEGLFDLLYAETAEAKQARGGA